MALNGKLRDQKRYYNAACGDHECLNHISWQFICSIQSSCRDISLKSTNTNFKVDQDEKSKGYTAGDHECLYKSLDQLIQ